MDSPPAGWYVDPDPLPKAPHPVRWWDGERWSDQQAWYQGQWVRRGAWYAGPFLFTRQHPFVTGWISQFIGLMPLFITELHYGGGLGSLALFVGLGLGFGTLSGLLPSRFGRKPTFLPPPPTATPTGRGPHGPPLAA